MRKIGYQAGGSTLVGGRTRGGNIWGREDSCEVTEFASKVLVLSRTLSLCLWDVSKEMSRCRAMYVKTFSVTLFMLKIVIKAGQDRASPLLHVGAKKVLCTH